MAVKAMQSNDSFDLTVEKTTLKPAKLHVRQGKQHIGGKMNYAKIVALAPNEGCLSQESRFMYRCLS